MKVKRYFAHNMRSALDMIKQEQGPDVLILSNRKVDGGVELVTADQLTEQEAEQLAQRNVPRKRPDVAAVAAERTAPAASPAPAQRAPAAPSALFADSEDQAEYLWTDAATMAQMREELRSLKGLLESQLSGLAWSEFGSRHPLRARLLRVLSQVGLSAALARQLVAEVPDELDYRAGWHRVLALLVMRLKVWDDDLLRHGGRVALLGPTGVGKSTLASKLAARFALAHGADRVSIVSMDDRRLGAHQQMKAFGRLIGSNVYTLRTIDELAEVLDDEADRGRLVVIDTPGHVPGDTRYNDLVLGLEGLLADIRMIKVLSATTDYSSAAAMFRRTMGLPLDACVLTKLDEAATLGPSLSAVIEAGLPLAWTCAGQRVPDDLDEVRPRDLIERMVELAKAAPVPDDQARIERAFSA
ncbi:MAG: flagellar biosynthesis protein FlhF [Gammaproteobacteria bacterium]|nr:flagellar biosynthesis protein FlhF [Gammaproteobacteria bacterium]